MKTLYKNVLLISIFLLISSSVASAATIDVGPGYTYQSISSGVAAAQSGDTVHVHAGTYTVTSPIVLKSGITLYGDGYANTIIQSTAKSDFASESAAAMMVFTGCDNTEVYGFKFKGPASSVSDIHDSSQVYYGGHDNYHSAIKLSSCNNVKIHDCYFTLLLGDGIRTSTSVSSNVDIYNNIFSTSGHDGIQVWSGKDFHIYNNYISVMINCGIRIANSANSNTEIDHNTFTNGLSNSGWTCIQIQGSTTGLNIHHNAFSKTTDNYAVTSYQSTGAGNTIVNNIAYSIPSPFVYNLPSATASNNVIVATEQDWSAQGFGYDSDTTGGGGTALPTAVYTGASLPSLLSPANGASVTPTNGRITLTWSNVNSTNYRVQVDTNSTFANATVATTANTAINVNVNNTTAATYYWRVAAYADSSSTWTAYTASRSFTTVMPTTVGKTGIFGIVYDTSTSLPIQSATVTLVNETWSSTYVTGEDGHYEFSVPYGSGTYYISASATEYTTTSTVPVVVTYDYIEKNIDMTKAQTYFTPHYVKFIVTDQYLIARYNATVSIYEGVNTNPLYSQAVGDDGSVTFKLSEDVEYTLSTLYNGKTQTDKIYPYDSTYYIILDDSITDILPAQFYADTNINVSKLEFNSTLAYVNVSYADLYINRTNAVNISVGRYDTNGTFVSIGGNQAFNKTAIVLSNGTVNASFIVSDYIGESYTVKVTVDHEVYGEVTKWYAVSFKGSNMPFNGKMLAYFCVFMLFVIAMQFGRAEHATGAILICGVFWLMYGIGVFDALGNTLTNLMAAGGGLAVVYALTVYINEKRKEDGI